MGAGARRRASVLREARTALAGAARRRGPPGCRLVSFAGRHLLLALPGNHQVCRVRRREAREACAQAVGSVVRGRRAARLLGTARLPALRPGSPFGHLLEGPCLRLEEGVDCPLDLTVVVVALAEDGLDLVEREVGDLRNRACVHHESPNRGRRADADACGQALAQPSAHGARKPPPSAPRRGKCWTRRDRDAFGKWSHESIGIPT